MKRVFLFCSLLSLSVVAAPKNETFGKNYKGGLLQRALSSQSSSSSSSNSGVASSKPSTDSVSAPTASSQNLDFEKPILEAKPEEASSSLINNLNFGGTIDARLYAPRPHGQTDKQIGFGNLDLHVVEVFLTTNVGDNISVLAEQLLVTSDMGNTVGQDHGFVYGIFSGLPGLSDNVSLKLGRFRNRFGVDAKMDAPANPLRSPVYSSIGTITDKGLELSGYWKWLDWSYSVTNGVDTLDDTLMTTSGEMVHAKREIKNESKPMFLRLGFELSDSFQLGLSAYTGKTYPVVSDHSFSMDDMIFNAKLDKSKLVRKDRAAVDAKLRLGSKVDFFAEYSFGQDKDAGQIYHPFTSFARLDYRVVPRHWTASLQYGYFEDGRPRDPAQNGYDRDTGNLGLGLTRFLSDSAWVRAVLLVDDRGIFRPLNGDEKAPEYLGVVQTLLAF